MRFLVRLAGELPPVVTASVLRKAIDEADKTSQIKKDAGDVLKPADNFGGRMSFRYVSTLSILLKTNSDSVA